MSMTAEEFFAADEGVRSRFFARVNKAGPAHPYQPEAGCCWLWTGGLAKGYGQIRVGRKQDGTGRLLLAHRLSLAIAGRPVPDGMFACHSCDLRRCVNPDHSGPGTVLDNARDMVGRHRAARGARNGSTKLSEEEVRAIRTSPLSGPKEAAVRGVSASLIVKIRSGAVWAHLMP